mmetsp:Transcript_25830/g.79715  ORF Transcript_25830/g.79715 Transcript_25830/m.79715 type:complete len:88 (+) Transcript_25830:166-429(+)
MPRFSPSTTFASQMMQLDQKSACLMGQSSSSTRNQMCKKRTMCTTRCLTVRQLNMDARKLQTGRAILRPWKGFSVINKGNFMKFVDF